MKGPTTAAARADRTITLKNLPLSTSGTRLRRSGRSEVAIPPKIKPIAAPMIQNDARLGAAIIAISSTIQLAIIHDSVRFGPKRSTSLPIM